MASNGSQSGSEAFNRVMSQLSATKSLVTGAPPLDAGGAEVVRSQVGLRDAAIKALAAAPSLKDRIAAIEAGTQQETSGGAWGAIGNALINNPVSKTILKGLTVVDTPRRAVISGLNEVVDALDSDPNTNASFSDFRKQTADVSYGFGKAFPVKGWLGRVIGFGGDVLLDPMTWATFGASTTTGLLSKGARRLAGKAALTADEQALRVALGGARRVSGFEGKSALAQLAANTGMADEIVKDIMVRGRLAVPAEKFAELGLRKPGVYMFGSRVYIPGSGPAVNMIASGMVGTKRGIVKAAPFESIAQKFTTGGVDVQRNLSFIKRGLARGEFSPEVAKYYVNMITADNFKRAAIGVARDFAQKTARPILENAAVRSAKDTVYRLLDSGVARETLTKQEHLAANLVEWAKHGIRPSEADLQAYDVLYDWRDLMHATVVKAFHLADPSLGIGKIDNWFPHLASERTLQEAEGALTARAEQIRKYLKTDITNPSGSFLNRGTKAGDDWFGHILTDDDIAKGAHRLNDLAYKELGYNFFETDMERVLKVYTGHFSEQMGLGKFMQEMIGRGAFKIADEEHIVNPDLIHGAQKTLSEGLSEVHATAVAASAAIKNVLADLDALVVRGVDQQEKGARAAVKKLGKQAKRAEAEVEKLPKLETIQKAAAKAGRIVAESKAAADAAWTKIRSTFQDSSELLDMLDASHAKLLKQHDETLAGIARAESAYANLAPDATVEQLLETQTRLQAQIQKLDVQIKKNKKAVGKAVALEQDITAALEWGLRTADDISADTLKSARKQFGRAGTSNKVVNVLEGVGKTQKGNKGPVAGKVAITDWLLRSEDLKVRRFLKEVDPHHTVKAAKLHRLTMERVGEILTRAQNGGANLQEVREAGVWLVMRDHLVRDGVPYETFGRIENVTTMLRQAKQAEEISKYGKLFGNVDDDLSTAGALMKSTGRSGPDHQELYTKAQQTLNEMERTDDAFVAELTALDGIEIDDYISKDLPTPPWLKEKQEIVDARWKANGAEIAMQRAVIADLAARGSLTPEFIDTVAVLSRPNGYRELTSQLANGLADYRVHSQASLQFSEIAAALRGTGLAPSESLYNNLARIIVEKDIVHATEFGSTVTTVATTLRDVASRVTGENRAGKLLHELKTLFTDTSEEGLKRIEALQVVFPEIEAVVRRKIQKTTVEGMVTELPEYDWISKRVAEVTREIGATPHFGQTGRAPVREAGILDLGGNSVHGDRMDFAVNRGLTSISKPAKEIDEMYGYVRTNLEQIEGWLQDAGKLASRGKLSKEELQQAKRIQTTYKQLKAAQDTAMEELTASHAASEAVRKARKAAAAAEKKATGKGVRGTAETYKYRAEGFNDFGFVASLRSALDGSQAAVDSFFADFLGGSKIDARAGVTGLKVEKPGVSVVRKSELTTAENFENVYHDAAGKVVKYKSSRKTIDIAPENSHLGRIEQEAHDRLVALKVIRDDGGTFPSAILEQGLPENQGRFVNPRGGMQAPEPVVRGTQQPTPANPAMAASLPTNATPAPTATTGYIPPTQQATYVPRVGLYARDLSGTEGYASALRDEIGRLETERAQVLALQSQRPELQRALDIGGYETRRQQVIDELEAALKAETARGPAKRGSAAVEQARARLERAEGTVASVTQGKVDDLYKSYADGFYETQFKNRINNLRAERSRLRLAAQSPENSTQAATIANKLADVEKKLGRLANAKQINLKAEAEQQLLKDVAQIRLESGSARAQVLRQKEIRAAKAKLNKAIRTDKEKTIGQIQEELAAAKARSVADMFNEDIANLEEAISAVRPDVTAEKIRKHIGAADAHFGTGVAPAAGASLDEVLEAGQKTLKATDAATKRMKAKPFVSSDVRDVHKATVADSDRLSREFFGIPKKVTSLAAESSAISDELTLLRNLSDAELAQLDMPSHARIRKQINLMKKLAETRQTILDTPKARNAKARLALKGLTDREAKLVKSLQSIQANAAEELVGIHANFVEAVAAFDGARLLRATSEETIATSKVQVNKLKELREEIVGIKDSVRDIKDIKRNRVEELKALRERGKDARQAIPDRNLLTKTTEDWVDGVDEFIAQVDEANIVANSKQLERNVAQSVAALHAAKAQFLSATQGLSIAQQDMNIINGLVALQKAGGIPNAVPGYTEAIRVFDSGFVSLSQHFPQIAVRKELAEFVQNIHRLSEPQTVVELSKALSAFTGFYKAYATTSPGFHIRNALSNGFMLFAAGAHPVNLIEGLRESHSWMKASSRGDSFEVWLATRPAHRREQIRLGFEGMVGSGGGMTDEVFKKLAQSIDGKPWFGTGWSRGLGTRIESHSRFMLSYDGALAGMDLGTILARTKRFLIDYEDVSTADKLMRQIVPFWMWTSRNFPMQIQNIWMNPKAYQIYGSIKRNISDPDGEGEMPQWMKDAGAFKLPFGNNLYSSPDIGFNRLQQQVNDFQNPSKLLANVNPAIRVPLELMGGKAYFNDREFSSKPVEVSGGVGSVLHPLLQALGYGSTGKDGKRYVKEQALYAALNMIPFLGKGESLAPSTAYGQERGISNAVLSTLGIPLKELKATSVASENDRRKRMIQELVRNQLALQPTG